MSTILVGATDLLSAIKWFDLFGSIAPVVTAGVAVLALRNWKRQDRAKREAEFLDTFIDAVHGFIVAMQRPIVLVGLAKIGMRSHVQDWGEGDNQKRRREGAIAYIKNRGERESKNLTSLLNDVQEPVVTLNNLTAKGQIFGFKEYYKIRNEVSKLTAEYETISAFNAVLAGENFNWDHPEIISLLDKITLVDDSEIKDQLTESNSAVLRLVNAHYKKIYG